MPDTSKNTNNYKNGVYDGKLSEATELLEKYPSLVGYDSTQTLTPTDNDDTTENDKEADDNWKNKITFENLPVYINTCGDGIWNGDGRWIDSNDVWTAEKYAEKCAITWYVKETKPSIANNPYTYGVGGHGTNLTNNDISDDANGNSDDTTLIVNSPSVTAKNVLKTRSIPVTKEWIDNDYGDSLHYDIDFTLKSNFPPTVPPATPKFSYEKTKKLETTNTEKTVTFLKVPIYDSDGDVIPYVVTEKPTYFDKPTKYGYVQTTENTLDSDNILESCTITNTLPVIQIKVDKEWDDSNNQDGQRPEQLNFKLKRKVIADEQEIIDNEFEKSGSDTSAKHKTNSDIWSYDFAEKYGVLPQYDENNREYIYSVTEEAGGDTTSQDYKTLSGLGYTRYIVENNTHVDQNNFVISTNSNNTDEISSAGSENNLIKTLHFRNEYHPKMDSLKIKKDWQGDAEFSIWTRPDTVTVTLFYYTDNPENKINLSDAPNNVPGKDDDPVKAQILANDSEYQFSRTINKDTWSVTFDNLPVYYNNSGSPVYNGDSQKIHYLVEETLEKSNVYKATYQEPTTLNGKPANEETEEDTFVVTNTLNTKTFTIKKDWTDNGYTDSDTHYAVNLRLDMEYVNDDYSDSSLTIPKDDENGISVTVPLYTKDGNLASYKITELTQKYGYKPQQGYDSVFVADETNSTITITNTLPLISVPVTKKWYDEQNKYGLRPENITLNLYRKRKDLTENWEPVEIKKFQKIMKTCNTLPNGNILSKNC